MEENDNNLEQKLEIESANIENKKENKDNKQKIKYILIIMFITLILVAIIVILTILFTNNNEGNKQEEEEDKHNWDNSYKKAEEFINKLNLTEQVNLLFGTENMKDDSIIVQNKTEKLFLLWVK